MTGRAHPHGSHGHGCRHAQKGRGDCPRGCGARRPTERDALASGAERGTSPVERRLKCCSKAGWTKYSKSMTCFRRWNSVSTPDCRSCGSARGSTPIVPFPAGRPAAFLFWPAHVERSSLDRARLQLPVLASRRFTWAIQSERHLRRINAAVPQDGFPVFVQVGVSPVAFAERHVSAPPAAFAERAAAPSGLFVRRCSFS